MEPPGNYLIDYKEIPVLYNKYSELVKVIPALPGPPSDDTSDFDCSQTWKTRSPILQDGLCVPVSLGNEDTYTFLPTPLMEVCYMESWEGLSIGYLSGPPEARIKQPCDFHCGQPCGTQIIQEDFSNSHQ